MKLTNFQNSVNATLWHLKLRKRETLKFFLSDATSQHYNITRIVQGSNASLFDTDLQSLNFTRLAMQVVTSDEILNISVFYCLQRTAQYRHITAHCTPQTHYSALHTTVTLQEFVLFNFALSSNIKPSTVSTDHYVCCYINWTDSMK
jgi:hypothetical protein